MEIHGTTLVGVANFSICQLNKLEEAILLSKYQIGLADIFHLMVASHLGCSNFLTFDQDFRTAKVEIQELFNLKVISNIDEIIATI